VRCELHVVVPFRPGVHEPGIEERCFQVGELVKVEPLRFGRRVESMKFSRTGNVTAAEPPGRSTRCISLNAAAGSAITYIVATRARVVERSIGQGSEPSAERRTSNRPCEMASAFRFDAISTAVCETSTPVT